MSTFHYHVLRFSSFMQEMAYASHPALSPAQFTEKKDWANEFG